MLVRIFGSAVFGIEARTISVEVSWTPTGRMYYIVGLPDNAIRESFQRIESAIKTAGYRMPRTKILVNLAPADIRKSGSAFDLPIAMGILAATGQFPLKKQLDNFLMMGELGLDGSVRPIRGALPMAMQAEQEGFLGMLLPLVNAPEAGVLPKLSAWGVGHISEVIEFLSYHENNLSPTVTTIQEPECFSTDNDVGDFGEVKGQENIKRALEIAAAGGHNAILIGPPGAGKTMLAKRFPSILPPMSLAETLETTRIHSVAGKLTQDRGLLTQRPFRSPHHTISHTALVGGGSYPQPGEISLAHHGVLFLDELPEFQKPALEVLRQPLEDRKVIISRARNSVEFPAAFTLIAAMNPCPCGYFNHPEKTCTCPPGLVKKYHQRISGPLLDRIDLHVEVTPIRFGEITDNQNTESSMVIRERVIRARKIQQQRYADLHPIHCNAQMGPAQIREWIQIDKPASQLLKTAMDRLQLSARAYDRILKTARTIADLEAEPAVSATHIAEAIQYRSLDRDCWNTS